MKKPKPRIKTSPKARTHAKLCDKLTRAIHDRPDSSFVISKVAQAAGLDYRDEFHFFTVLMGRCHCEVSTSQQPAADQTPTGYVISMKWSDYEASPLHGYHYPMQYAVKNSQSLLAGATLTYLQLCKNIGRFI